jgi:hypothetical protein
LAREFYLAASTALTKKFYADLQAAGPRLGKVSAIGGWAVYELVEPRFAMESLDVDILIHDTATWTPTIRFIRDQGFVWRKVGRSFDRRLVLPGHENDDGPAVDVFYSNAVDQDLLQNLFGVSWTANMKEMPYTGFVPALPALVADKVATLPRRPPHDPKRKRLKDALDLHALLFHNLARAPARELLRGADISAVARALDELTDVAPYEAEMRRLRDVLSA